MQNKLDQLCKDLEIKAIYNDFLKQVVVFTFTIEQYEQAIILSNKLFNTKFKKYEELALAERTYGFVLRKAINTSNVGLYCVLNINFDLLKKLCKEDPECDVNIRILETINHELQHLVETINEKLIPKQHGYLVQEPKAYSMSWVTRKFYEEFKRQGFTLEFIKTP